VASGAVHVDGAVVTKGSTRVHEGADLVIDAAPPTRIVTLEPDPTVDVTVVYEDDDLLVVDKPAGLVVHPGAGNDRGTLVQGLLARDPALASIGDPARPGIVHRIDKETSGLLVVARSSAGYAALSAAIAAHGVTRQYLALVWGEMDAASGLIDAPIGRSAREPTRMAVSARGREARTSYEVIAVYDEPAVVSVLRCTLDTGRTHQIRVHLQAIGHPVVGDRRYGGHREPFADLGRFFLHAAHLGLDHPTTGAPLEFDSPLPPELESVVSRLTATVARRAPSRPHRPA
jgi:23S rRNA pseudouridine1911/1915/1917 synthase